MNKTNKIKATITVGAILAGTATQYIYKDLLYTFIVAIVIVILMIIAWKHIEEKNKVVEEVKEVEEEKEE